VLSARILLLFLTLNNKIVGSRLLHTGWGDKKRLEEGWKLTHGKEVVHESGIAERDRHRHRHRLTEWQMCGCSFRHSSSVTHTNSCVSVLDSLDVCLGVPPAPRLLPHPLSPPSTPSTTTITTTTTTSITTTTTTTHTNTTTLLCL